MRDSLHQAHGIGPPDVARFAWASRSGSGQCVRLVSRKWYREENATSKQPSKRKPDPCGPGLQFVGAGPTITFQRGTADDLSIAIWEDGQPAAASDSQYAASNSPDNTKGRMPAMRGPQIYGEFADAFIPTANQCVVVIFFTDYGTDVGTDGNAVMVEAEGR